LIDGWLAGWMNGWMDEQMNMNNTFYDFIEHHSGNKDRLWGSSFNVVFWLIVS